MVINLRLPFEDWLDNQRLNVDTKDLFAESIKSYKASAYRAALTFSWIGFQSMIREVILSSKAPVDYTDDEWGRKLRQAGNESNWDDVVFGIVKQKIKPMIKLSDDVYEQYMYWKQRRNDCAHAKGNLISTPHVEAFWLFMQSNSNKFVVNGGLVHFIKNLQDYFNPVFTPPNTNVSPLVRQVPSAVEVEDFENLLLRCKVLCEASNMPGFIDKDWREFWGELFNLPEAYREKFIKFLLEEDNKDFTRILLYLRPDIIKYFNGQPRFIRSLWKGFSTAHTYCIVIHLLRHNMIPNDQLDELFDHMVENVDSDLFGSGLVTYEVNDFDITSLKEKGFFDYFYKQAFEEKKIVNAGFEWGNRNKDLVTFYIKKYDINQTVSIAIEDVRTKTNYAPRHLKAELSQLFKSEPELKDRIDEFLVEHYKSLMP